MHEAPAERAAVPAASSRGRDRILLVGNPNVGKSALFGALTGNYVNVSNYPGTTVEVTTGTTRLTGRKMELVDTPGANSFLPTSEDERVTRDMLLDSDPHAVLAVGDAKNLERSIHLALQLSEMRVPHVFCLNMLDEARARGLSIRVRRLSELLGVDLVQTAATRRHGIQRLGRALMTPKRGTARIRYPAPVEEAVSNIESLLPEATISRRALALMVLSGDETLVVWLRGQVSEQALCAIEEERQRLRRAFREPVSYVISGARQREAWRIAAEVQVRRKKKADAGRTVLSWLERKTTHPIWGVPVLAAVLFLVYQFVGVFGAGTLVDLLETKIFGEWVNPGSTWLADRLIPWEFLRDLLVGPYGVVTMALTYSLALILPIVGTFFIAFGILEDSGYLPRFAVMVNRWLKGIGLNGKAVLPMVLGLGCATMATLTTRILETRKERLIAILLLALGIPCSAQLTVILAMLGSISLLAMGIWIGVVLGVVLLVGSLASRLLPGRGSDFVLELPPLRLPQPRNILIKTAARIEWYLKEAVPLFVLGTLILFIVDRLRVLGWLEQVAAPVLSGWLGLPKESAAAFIIGFLRRDFGAAGLYRMSEAGQLDAVQALVAVVTITLFIPCIANFFMIARERGWRTAGLIAAFIFPFAILVGTALNWVLRALVVTL